MVDLADVIDLVTRAVSEDSAVQALVPSSSSIHSGHVQDGDTGSVEYPLVVVAMTGPGAIGYQGSVIRLEFEVYAYSRRSSSEALRLHHAVSTALQARRLFDPTVLASGARNNTFTGYSRSVGGMDTGFNDRVQGWYVRSLWAVQGAG